jgi:eukaryotic-like serine/threonine-protein kinase
MSARVDARGVAALAELPIKIGSLVATKYRVDRILGAGGMGVVVAATHVDLGQVVAIKLMLPNAALDRDLLARFSREARMTAQLRGEHVARVLDVGVDGTGVHYLAMEYLEGTDLSRLLRERGPMPAPLVADYVLQVCEGLAEAHRHGMVHRDIKPANLFLMEAADGQECIKVLDFGIAKGATPGADIDGITMTQAFMGSPLYMSPEQLRSARDVGPQSDIWSVGAVLYALLTGRPPYDYSSIPELCAAVLYKPYRNMFELTPHLAPGLERIVARCLERDLGLRFASVVDLADALAPFAGANGAVRAGRVRRMHSGVKEPRSSMPAGLLSSSGPLESSESSRVADASPLQVGSTHMASAASSVPPAPARRAGRSTWVVVIAAATLVVIAAAGLMGGPILLAKMDRARHRSGEAGPAAATTSLAEDSGPLGSGPTGPAAAPASATPPPPVQDEPLAPDAGPAAPVAPVASVRPVVRPHAAPVKRPDTETLPGFGGRK